jgi:putative ABC transport system permease protein
MSAPTRAPTPDGSVGPVRPAPPAAADWAVLLEPLPEGAGGPVAFGQSLEAAVEALRANTLRSLLTMLGIIIGVGAVIVMVALGEGASRSVQQRLARLGTNMLTVQAGSFGGPGGPQAGAGSTQTLTEADARAIRDQVAGVSALSPVVRAGGVQVQAGGQNWSTEVQGYYPDAFVLQSWGIAQGAAFDEDDEDAGALVAVLGRTVATNLFGVEGPVGQTILVRNVAFKVKGVLAAKGSDGFRDQDDVVLMPFSTAQARLFHQPYVREIYVQAADADRMAAVQEEISALLRTRHRLQETHANDFTVRNNQQMIETVESTSDALTYLLAGVAAVSLVVGGIGIMNIMLVSVTERTHEIGIRMAVGARRRTILTQFLTEAVILSLVGGLIGIALGVGGSYLLTRLASWSTAVTWPAVALSFGFAAVVGVFFGFYPARRAARLDPIEALRHE